VQSARVHFLTEMEHATRLNVAWTASINAAETGTHHGLAAHQGAVFDGGGKTARSDGWIEIKRTYMLNHTQLMDATENQLQP